MGACLRLVISGACAVLFLSLAWWGQEAAYDPLEGAAAGWLASTPGPSKPRLVFAFDPNDPSEARLVGDLAAATRSGGIDLALQNGDARDGAAHLGLMHYDALAAAAHRDQVRVVTPLFTEEVYVIVRRDSPLEYIHQLDGARVNFGSRQGSRSLTVQRLYQSLFGGQLPPAQATFLPDDEALRRLVEDRSIDAMLLLAPQPAPVLIHRMTQIGRGIKLLKLDAGHGATRKALEGFPPGMLQASSHPGWLDADVPTFSTMAFLVTVGEMDEGGSQRLAAFTDSWCATLASLRRSGHPKWRQVQSGRDVETGQPALASAKVLMPTCLSVA